MPSRSQITPAPSAEAALLIRCCIPGSDHQNEHRDDDAPHPPDFDFNWPRFIALAERNAAVPLVARWAAAAPSERIPAVAKRTIKISGEACALRAARLTDDLLDILDWFNGIGIDALAFKGPVLGMVAYGDAGLRSFTDLDVLVPSSRVRDAGEILISHGFRCREFNPKFLETRFFSDDELVFTRAHDMLHVDLHWGLLPDFYPFAADPESLWKRAVEVPLGAGRVRTLGYEDLLLFLCAHAAKHGWNAFNRIADLAYLCHSHRELNWDFVLAEAARLGSRRILFLGLQLAHSLLRAPLPANLLAMADDDPKVARLAAVVTRRLLRSQAPYDGPFAEWGVGLASIEGLKGRARYCWYRVMAPKLTDGALLPLPRGLFPLYYVARPLLLAIKHRGAFFAPRAAAK